MERKVEGATAIQRLQMISNKITSGKLHLDVRQSVMDVNLLNELVRKKTITNQSDLVKQQKAKLLHMKTCHRADVVCKKNQNKDITKWKSKVSIKIYLMPLKLPSDAKMPDTIDGLLNRYKTWKFCARQQLSTDPVVLSDFQKWLDKESSNTKG